MHSESFFLRFSILLSTARTAAMRATFAALDTSTTNAPDRPITSKATVSPLFCRRCSRNSTQFLVSSMYRVTSESIITA
jgi:hypothetical protein